MIGDDEPPPPPEGGGPAAPTTNPNQQTGTTTTSDQTTPAAGSGNEGTETERAIDNALAAPGQAARDTAAASHDAGDVKQNLADGDQDTADKGSNAGHDAADGLDNLANAVDALGGPGAGNDLRNAANWLDNATDTVFGKKEAPSSLPPVRYRVFFGKKDDLMGGLESMGESLLGDAMSAGDSLLEQGAKAIGADKYLGDDPMSSMLEQHNPFNEDEAELDKAESIWRLVRINVEEGLNFVWRAEILLSTGEIADPTLEAQLDQEAPPGGLLDQIAGPVKSALSAFDAAKELVNGNEGANDSDADESAAKEKELQAKEAELVEVRDEIKQLDDDLAAAQAESPQDPQRIAGIQSRLTNARNEEQRILTELQTLRADAARLRARSRDDKSAIGDRVGAVTSGIDKFNDATDTLGKIAAIGEMVFGGEKKAYPDAPVFVNVPLDPADFLGQTVSVRVTREFMTAGNPATNPNDITGYPFSARYLTGVVVEMRDLGVRKPPQQPPTRAATPTRFLKLVLMPELAKLSLRRDHRVFQKVNALQIVREILRKAGVYGFLPDIPLVGEALGGLSSLAGNIPFVGSAMGDALAGQFIRTIPPPSKLGSYTTNEDPSVALKSPLPEAEWTMEREMCCQYGETDLDFFRRLLEEEGIHFTFEHRRGFERLVLVHDPRQLDEAPTVDGKPVRFRWPTWADQMAVESVWRAYEKLELASNKITLHDYNMSNAHRPTARVAPSDNGASYYERFEYPASFAYQYDKDQPEPHIHYRDYKSEKDRDMAHLRLEEQAAGARRVRFYSDVIGVESGATVKLRGFPFQRDGVLLTDEPPKADLLIVDRVRWKGGDAIPRGQSSDLPMNVPVNIPEPYENEVTAWWSHPLDPRRTPVRPARITPKPRITSLQTATVVDTWGEYDEDEEVSYDDRILARVLVRFHWDRRGEGLPILPRLDGDITNIGNLGRGTTCWVRVAHTWAGPDYGVHFVPRVGSEVVIAFENGDPDRPYIVGCLYDGEHPMPIVGRETKRDDFTPPEVKPVTMSTISTRTSPWDEEEGVSSELTFDDDMGKERILLKAGRYLIEEVRGAQSTKVRRNQYNEVGGRHGEIVEKQQELDVLGSRTKLVKNDHLVEVRGLRSSDVGGKQEVKISATHDEEIGKTVDLHIVKNRKLTVHTDRVTNVGKEGDDPQHDIHEVTGTKTDTIVGALEVLSGSFSVGQQGEGPEDPDTAIEAGPSMKVDPDTLEQKEGYAVNVKAQKETASIDVRAQKEVKIVSNNESVTFFMTAHSELMVAGSKIDMAESTDIGITVKNDTRVQIHTKEDVLLLTPDQVRLAAQGKEPTVTEVTSAKVAINGPTGVVVATVDIRGFPDVMKMG
jgi:type VI secretion system VgrG family protein